MNLPFCIRLWKWLHDIVNRLAWRYARPPGPTWNIANRIDRRRLLWRLNDWLAVHWIDYWMVHR